MNEIIDKALDAGKQAAMPVVYVVAGAALMGSVVSFMSNHPQVISAVISSYCQVDEDDRLALRAAVNEASLHQVEITCR